MTFQPAPRKIASSSWITLPLPRTGPSRRCRLQLTTKTRLSSCSRGASEMAPSDSGSSHLAVAEEAPHPALAGVVDLAVVEVAVEAGVVERADRAEAHADRRVLPEVGHQAGVRVARQAAAAATDLPAEVVEVVGREAALHERPGVDAGRGVALEVDGVAGVAVVLAAEEVVEADLVERLAELANVERWPPMPSACLFALTTIIAAFQRTKARMRRSMCSSPGNHGSCSRGIVLTYGVRHGGREADLRLLGPLEQLGQQEAGPGLAAGVDDGVERVQPLLGLVRDRCRGSDGRSRRRSWRQSRTGSAGFVARAAAIPVAAGTVPGRARARSSSTPMAPAPGTPDPAAGPGRWPPTARRRAPAASPPRRTSGWRSPPCSRRCGRSRPARPGRRRVRLDLRRQLLPRPLVRPVAGQRLAQRQAAAGRQRRPLAAARRAGHRRTT